jgi:siderophore synthetase component
MNAPLLTKPITQRPEISPQAERQAKHNGLFRLLRSVLRENLFEWQNKATSLILSDGSSNLILAKPIFDDLGGLQHFSTLFWLSRTEHQQITDPITALDKIISITKSTDNAWKRISAEIKNSVDNEALTISWRHQKNKLILNQYKQQDLTNLLQWSRYQSAQENSAIILEQWSAIGHPYHPGSKTKLGLSTDEVWQYSPEFGPEVPLILIAVHSSLLSVTTQCPRLDYKHWFQTQYPDWYQQWMLQFGVVDLGNYLPIPVHPWQLKHKLPDLFAEEITLLKILLEGPSFLATPTLSCRTLAPGLNTEQPYIKLPVAAQMTSSIRNLSASSVDNAPLIGSVLQDILTLRPDIAAVLRCQWDEVGLHSCVDNEKRDNDRYLSVIFRRNPARLLEENEHAVVIAALFTPTPTSDEPLFIELMRLAGITHQQGAMNWFGNYVSTLFNAVLSLFLDYGLSLEAHQQNMMAIFNDSGQLQGFINRDVGGICIHQPTLSIKGWPINFTHSAILVDSLDEARINFSHTVLQSHIGELIKLTEGYFQLSTAQLWHLVAVQLHQRLVQFEKENGQAAYQREMQAFFKQPWPGTAFLRMRLQDQSQHNESLPIKNPLTDMAIE